MNYSIDSSLIIKNIILNDIQDNDLILKYYNS